MIDYVEFAQYKLGPPLSHIDVCMHECACLYLEISIAT